MRYTLSGLVITKNAKRTVSRCLSSIKFCDEIIIIDDFSSDGTSKIINRFIQNNNYCRLYQHHEHDLGRQRAFGLSKCTKDWILMIDADEIVSRKLQDEIESLLKKRTIKENGFYIPFQNHFLGRPVSHGGENYKKLILVKKKAAEISPALVHEHLLVKGSTGQLKNKIYHYSYRSLGQMYRKFTDYAVRDAKQRFYRGERSSLKKILLYPLHMFWARFIKDKGYRDGWFRLPLDFGFAYMEWLTYVLLFIYRIKKIKT